MVPPQRQEEDAPFTLSDLFVKLYDHTQSGGPGERQEYILDAVASRRAAEFHDIYEAKLQDTWHLGNDDVR